MQVLRDYDDDERAAHEDEVDAAGDERHEAQQGVAPEPTHTLLDLPPQVAAGRVGRALDLEVGAHEEERDDRNSVTHSIEEEGEGFPDTLVEEASQARPGHAGGGEGRHVLRGGLRQLVGPDDARQGRYLGNVEEDEEGALGERHSVYVPYREGAGEGGDGNNRKSESAYDV